MRKRKIVRRIARSITWLLLTLLTVILLLFGALQLPFIQDRLTGELEKMLRSQFNTDIQIGRIGMDFPKSLTIEDVFIPTPEGDSLFALGKLSADLNMLRLFKREVVIQNVTARDIYARLINTDSTSNIAFLLEAMVTGDTTLRPPPDGAAAAPDTSLTWSIQLSRATYSIERADIYYQDDPTGILFDGQIGALLLRTDEIDLEQFMFKLQNLELADADMYVRVQEASDTSGTSAMPPQYLLSSNEVAIDRTRFRLESEPADIDTYLGKTVLSATELGFGREFRFVSNAFEVQEGRYAMDLPGPVMDEGIDFAHLGLSEVYIDASDVNFAGDTIRFRLNAMEAKDKSGLGVQKASGQLFYLPDLIELEQFSLRTDNSSFDIPLFSLRYNFQLPPQQQSVLRLDARAQGSMAIRDLLYFAPDLASIDILRQNKEQNIEMLLSAGGNQQRLDVERMVLDAPGLSFRGRATAFNILQTDSLRGTLQLDEFAALPKEIIPLLPDTLLPAYINWPRALQARGNVRYDQDQVRLSFTAREQREATPLNSILVISGTVDQIDDYPSTNVDLTIDTLRATRYSLLAYLPPNSVPEAYTLPEFLIGRGSIQGPVNNLDLDLQLATAAGRTQVRIDGQLNNFMNPDSLDFNFTIPELVVDIPELRQILPPNTLPEDLNFPDFRITNASISGRPDDLQFRLPFETINGEGIVRGDYAPEDFMITAEVSGFRLENIYSGARADSIALLDLAPLNITMEASGQLEPYLDTKIYMTVYEGNKGALVNLSGTAVRDTFQGQMTFSHVDLQGTAEATYVQGDSLQRIATRVNLERVDLERWRLSDRTLFLSGRAAFSAVGLEPDNLSARIRMDDILLRSDTSTAYVDTLVGYAEMHNGNNDIEIISDLLLFTLQGTFRPTLVAEEMNRFIQAYWQEEIVQPDPVVYGNYMQAFLEIRNPRPLTTGIIPGLREISRSTANLIYREQEPELLFQVKLPKINYAGIDMDSLVVEASGSVGELLYEIDWQNIDLFNQVVLGRTQLAGTNTEEAIKATFTVWDEEGEPRHRIAMIVDPETDSLLVRLAPEQMIDKLIWQIPNDNRLLVTDRQFDARNWRLSFEDQTIFINTPRPDQVVLGFEAVNLAPFGRLIRSEEEIIAGRLNGNVQINNVISEPRIDAQVVVNDLSVYTKLWGDMKLALANVTADRYRIDLSLSEAANDLVLAGTFEPQGMLDLRLEVDALQLQSIEPLSLGYLTDATGYLSGEVNIGGSVSAPRYQGSLQFIDAAVDIELLQTRFRIGDQPIQFNGGTISVNQLTLYDTENNEATLSGTVVATSLTSYRFNLQARARDFLVLNTTREDNPLYYGNLRVDADATIGGTIYQPEMTITASPRRGSELTYIYTIAAGPQAESQSGVVRFVEQYEWRQTIVADSLQRERSAQQSGFALTTNINVNPNLKFTVIIDPITGDRFVGRGTGDITFTQYPDGKMDMVGRVELIEGLYDFTYQGLISRQFAIEPTSSISWQGDPLNPSLDLVISSYIKASPYPLVSEFSDAGSVSGNLRRQQTFAVRLYLDGTLQEMTVSTDIIYPEDYTGNTGLPAIDQSLTMLRNDQSQLNTQAFGLLLFKGFINFGDNAAPAGGGFDQSIQSSLDNVLTQQLNSLANRYIGFVELDFGMESFSTDQGGVQRDLRLSLRKRLFNNRLIISIDGVTQTGEADEANTLPQTYLDNLTAEYLLTRNGTLRLKVFSDRDFDQFTTGNVVRVGGRLAFSKDFDRLLWFSQPESSEGNKKNRSPEDGTREQEQKIKLEQQ